MKKFYFLLLYQFFVNNCSFVKNLLGGKGVFLSIVLSVLFQVISLNSSAQNIFSYSYQNVTRDNGGGTLEKGDIIEVRALAKVDSKTGNFYYIDTIRAGTQYVSKSLKIITNEGLLFKGTYTDAGGDDLGVYDNSGGVPRLRVNIGTTGAANPISGTGATQFGSTSGGGIVNPNDKPKFYGTTLFVVAYRLMITANYGDVIYLTGNYYFDSTSSDGKKSFPGKKYRFNYPGIKIIQNQDLCSNFSSATFTAESDFGIGKIQNRAAGANVPGYNKVPLNANDPGDGNYAIANNTSANGAATKVFNVWDIIGDHTGATNPALGNSPTPVGVNGGYMLVVNAAFPTGEAYRDNIKNVCPNTYYEFSAWIRNICGKCSLDADGNSPGTPGVQPNLAFTINDIDYYTTGSIPYNQQWVKRGFIYKTGPTETQFNITIKNNAPGGGGNDWVLDDIKLATCYPNLTMNPSDTAKACTTSILSLSDTVRSYFNNYVFFCWEKSVDDINWVSTGVCGTKVPVLKNGLYEYVVDTAFIPTKADSGAYYRLKVATTLANLSNVSCAVNGSQRVFLKVNGIGCKVVEAKFLNFEGSIANNKSLLKWVTQNELNVKEYEVEKSSDGIHFIKIGTVASVNDINKANYLFNDPEPASNVAYYRLKLVDAEATNFKYSKIVVVFNKNAAFKISMANPFKDNLKIDIFVPDNATVAFELFNMYGKIVSKKIIQLTKGNRQTEIENVSGLPAGVYILKATNNGMILQNKLIKLK
jgi:hypothetical protein